MSDLRRSGRDIAAGTLFLGGLAVALAVFSYDPTTAVGQPSRNLLGPAGDWVASGIVEALGLAVDVLFAAWFVLVLMLLLRRAWLSWSLRLLGWLLLIPLTAVTSDSLGTDVYTGPSLGGGGSLGAWLSLELEDGFEPAGRFAILGGASILGVILALDFILAPLLLVAGRCMVWSWRAAHWLLVPRLQANGRRKPSGETHSTPTLQPGSSRPPLAEEEEEPQAHAESAPAPTHIPIHHADPNAEAPAAEESAPVEDYSDYELPGVGLLDEPRPFPCRDNDRGLRERAVLLEKTFADFNLKVRVVGIHTGPVITQYEIALETGLRVHKVTALADDLALNLGVPGVRIVAPIPNKNTVGIEIPNEQRAVVSLKEVMLGAGFKAGVRSGWAAKAKLPLFLGKDTEGRPLVYDLAEMPHLLIAGRTGTGKSVCMNALILSLLMTRRPDEVKMIMIDPKMLELDPYGRVPHLMHPVVTDMKKAEAILAWAVDKMEERYDLLKRARVRGIAGYNELEYEEVLRRVKPEDEEERQRVPEKMPYIVIFIDEMADLMIQMKKEVEGHIIRLAQKSRAAGIHLVTATQKPTVDVITGLIKSNLPARVCFQVSSRTDSRVVLDEMGADKLLGKGDMLFLQPGTSSIVRAQGTYASNEEITRVVEHLETNEPCYSAELMQLNTSGRRGKGDFVEHLRERDEVYEEAIEVVVREGRGSVSLLQRALGIGYGRAARLIDFMAEDGIVGPYNGSNARDVLYTPEQWEQVKHGGQMVESA
jgi:S-DNA-T family DNA segregation ATPase FtsK/SpoIIIE